MALLGRKPEPQQDLGVGWADDEAAERRRPAPGKVTRTMSMPGRISRFALQISRRPSDKQLTRDHEDSTTGLTRLQRAALAPSLATAQAIHGKAVRPPAWDAMQADVGALDGALQAAAGGGATSLARAKLAPAQAASQSMSDLIAGAKSKQSAVTGANKHLLVAREALDAPTQPVEINGQKFSSREDLEVVIAEARQNNGVAKGPVAGTVIQVGDEHAFRKKYQPLTVDEKATLIGWGAAIDGMMKQLAGPAADPAAIKDRLESMHADLRAFNGPSIGEVHRASIDKAIGELGGAITVLLAQIAPIDNTLGLIRSNAMEARTAIQATLDLPERPDPGDPQSKTAPVKPSPELLNEMGNIADRPPAEVKPIDRKASGGAAGAADDVFDLIGTISGGQSLPGAVRDELEAGLGVDLGGVRIHTGAEAATAADTAAARAFAVGNDIYFSAGAFDPHSREGKRLLAHEVVHTVQQRGATGRGGISEPGDPAEREADAIADELVDGGGRAPELQAAPTVARQEEKKFKTAKDLDFPATSDPYALGQIRSCLNPKSPASAIIGGRGMHVAHADMLALGFVFRGVSGQIRNYSHPDFPEHRYQIIIIDPAAPEADYQPPVDREVEERINERPEVAEARRHAREWQTAARGAWPNSEALNRLRRQGQGDSPEYQRHIDEARAKYARAQLWEDAFNEKMPGWKAACADDARALAELDTIAGTMGEAEVVGGWVDDYDNDRSREAQDKADEARKAAEEYLKNPPPPPEEEPPPDEEEPPQDEEEPPQDEEEGGDEGESEEEYEEEPEEESE